MTGCRTLLLVSAFLGLVIVLVAAVGAVNEAACADLDAASANPNPCVRVNR